MITSNPECFVLWLHCLNPTTFLPKGQILAQVIPAPDSPETEGVPPVNAVKVIREDKLKETCQLTVGGETKIIKGLLDTGADVTIIPGRLWPSHWALQSVPGHRGLAIGSTV